MLQVVKVKVWDCHGLPGFIFKVISQICCLLRAAKICIFWTRESRCRYWHENVAKNRYKSFRLLVRSPRCITLSPSHDSRQNESPFLFRYLPAALAKKKPSVAPLVSNWLLQLLELPSDDDKEAKLMFFYALKCIPRCTSVNGEKLQDTLERIWGVLVVSCGLQPSTRRKKVAGKNQRKLNQFLCCYLLGLERSKISYSLIF